MSVRKRKWTSSSGAEHEAWVVDYVDGAGQRRLKTFSRKKDADAYAATASVQVREGTHVADSVSVTIERAGELWLAGGDAAGLERTTIDQRRQHLHLHINPLLGGVLLSKLSVPTVRQFEDRLREGGRSAAMIRKVLSSLGALVADAQERGLTSRNPVRDIRATRRRGSGQQAERRGKGRLKAGVDIPTPDEIRKIIGALSGKWRPVLLTAIFTGLRASELRGLRWLDVDFAKGELQVHQRADRFNRIGRPKTAAGERVVPLPPIVVNTLREWKLACPKGSLDLVFPNGNGNVESLGNLINRGLVPSQLVAGVTRPALGSSTLRAKYTGMHALRHFYASWCINRREDGGLGLPPKVVQERLGHSSIVMTMDVYGHLFPRGDDSEAMATAVAALLG